MKNISLNKVFIIAEAGVNHNGNLGTAKRLIDAAKEAGADAVKFQAFSAGKIATLLSPKAEYQKAAASGSETQLSMLKKLELTKKDHKELKSYAGRKDIIFMSSPFDIDSVNMLRELGLDIIKIPSGEITNLPYLRKIGELNKKIFLSTGMSNIKEIKEAVKVLTASGTDREKIVIMHCNTEYPTPYEDVNLNVIHTLINTFGDCVGYSDHTPGIEVSVAAAAIGAVAIEKHFTLDKKMKGPDHSSSLEPDEFKNMTRSIRNIEKSFGTDIKQATGSELKNINIVRKSIVASKTINKGDLFTDKNITVKRPGTGISPMRWDDVLGKKAIKNFFRDEMIEI